MKTTYHALWQRLVPLYGRDEAQAVVRLLLDEGFALSLADVCCGAVERLGEADCARLERMMQRLEQAEPVQYVLGSASFGGRQFRVSPAVLIPRPETWQLVEEATRFLHGRDWPQEGHAPTVLDIGTGSGCIAVSVALACREAWVSAWDISDEALAMARNNAERLGARVSFAHQDALSPPKDSHCWDLLVSNPPYVCDSERPDMSRHVLDHEPETALFVPDSDPLLFYRAIADYAKEALRPRGRLLFETNTRFAHAVAELLRDRGFTQVHVLNDLYEKPRHVVGTVGASPSAHSGAFS